MRIYIHEYIPGLNNGVNDIYIYNWCYKSGLIRYVKIWEKWRSKLRDRELLLWDGAEP